MHECHFSAPPRASPACRCSEKTGITLHLCVHVYARVCLCVFMHTCAGAYICVNVHLGVRVCVYACHERFVACVDVCTHLH